MKLTKLLANVNAGFQLLDYQQKVKLFLIIFLAILLSVLEVLSITGIMPFIALAANPHILTQNAILNYIYLKVGFRSQQSFAINFGVCLIIFYILRGIYGSFYLYFSNRFIVDIRATIGNKLLATYLDMSYQNFTSQNSDAIGSSAYTLPEMLSSWLQPWFLLLSELFIAILIYLFLLIANFKMTIILSLILIVKIILISKVLFKKLKQYGGARLIELRMQCVSFVGGVLGSFKIVKLRNNRDGIIDEFKHLHFEISRLFGFNQLLNLLPRLILETSGFSLLIGVVLYILFRNKDLSELIPIMTMYALALYRLLPSVNRVVANYNQIVFYSVVVDSIRHDLLIPTEQLQKTQSITFNHTICLKQVAFNYLKDHQVLHNIDLRINKGEKIGIIGASGGGKSTLVDLIIGLLKPGSGQIYIDDTELTEANTTSWRNKIGYIPQNIYLFDGSVAENVAFGLQYDQDKIVECLKLAKVYDFLLTKDGINTNVGSNGIQLSGGQKQRIGIARALYGNHEILVLDEATSALDSATEKEVMEEIYQISANTTLIVVAHRITTLANCDRIVEIDQGRVIERKDAKADNLF